MKLKIKKNYQKDLKNGSIGDGSKQSIRKYGKI